MPHLELEKKTKLSSFRRIAIGTWQTAYDPSVYGSLTVRADKALHYLEAFRAATGRRLTLSHLIAKAMGLVLQGMPDANAILRFNRPYVRKRIAIFFQVAMEDPETGEIDLSGVKVIDPEQKSILAILDEFEKAAARVRKGQDKDLEQTRGTFKLIPFFLLNTVLKTISFLLYTLNLDMRWAGLPRDPFGSCMVTNIGSLDLDEAYVPLVPYARVPLLVSVGAVRDEAIIVDGAVTHGKMLKLCATFDHRVLDGSHMAAMVKTMRACFADPEKYFGSIEGAAAELKAGASAAASPPAPSGTPAA